MARERDITRRPKFFVRKQNVTDDQLCDRCRFHQYVGLVKYGCDAIMFSNVVRSGVEAAANAGDGQYIHMWCINDEEARECLQYFRVVGPVQ